MTLSGYLGDLNYWGGISLHSVKTFTATPDLPLSFEMDRVSIDPLSFDGITASTAARTGVLMAGTDRSPYFFFGQNAGETGWEVNVNATGSGTALADFASIADFGSHHMQMIADGTYVSVYLDGVFGGTFDFPVATGITFDVAVYARDLNDAVTGVFDNVKIQNIYPAITVAPDTVSTIVGMNDNTVTVTIPRFLNATADAQVTVASANPSVAVAEGATGGSLTLTFPLGAANTQTFKVKALAPGVTTLNVTSAQGATVANGVNVTVLPAPKVVLQEEFAGNQIDSAVWSLDDTPLTEGGTLNADSSTYITNGMLAMVAHCETADWTGYSLLSKSTYAASELSPVDFDIDRVKMEYVQIGGNTTKERAGVWVKSGTNYVFFNFLDTHDGSANGWRYNVVKGSTADTALPADGVGMSAFGAASFNTLGSHRLKVQVNGASVKLYVDGVFGASVPFAATDDIVFGFGAYANYSNDAGNIVRAFWDNATVTTYPEAAELGSLAVAKQANGDVVVSWTGAGTLQSSTGLPGGWTDVSPAPTGTSYTVPAASQGGARFFRLRQ